MKKFFLAAAAAFALMAAPTFACETKPIANSNATQRVDTGCQIADNTGAKSFLFIGGYDDDADPSTPDVAALKADLGGDVAGVLTVLN